MTEGTTEQTQRIERLSDLEGDGYEFLAKSVGLAKSMGLVEKDILFMGKMARLEGDKGINDVKLLFNRSLKGVVFHKYRVRLSSY